MHMTDCRIDKYSLHIYIYICVIYLTTNKFPTKNTHIFSWAIELCNISNGSHASKSKFKLCRESHEALKVSKSGAWRCVSAYLSQYGENNSGVHGFCWLRNLHRSYNRDCSGLKFEDVTKNQQPVHSLSTRNIENVNITPGLLHVF